MSVGSKREIERYLQHERNERNANQATSPVGMSYGRYSQREQERRIVCFSMKYIIYYDESERTEGRTVKPEKVCEHTSASCRTGLRHDQRAMSGLRTSPASHVSIQFSSSKASSNEPRRSTPVGTSPRRSNQAMP